MMQIEILRLPQAAVYENRQIRRQIIECSICGPLAVAQSMKAAMRIISSHGRAHRGEDPE